MQKKPLFWLVFGTILSIGGLEASAQRKVSDKNITTMKSVLHKANTRGHANHGWLNSYHTFSFANYYNPERVHFGALRVLNDDTVAAGMGFGTHPHDNMEIISIPLEGLMSSPPVSKQTPLPTRVSFLCFGFPHVKSIKRGRRSLAMPTA